MACRRWRPRGSETVLIDCPLAIKSCSTKLPLKA
ncbi:hypothetical protein RHECNPAF_12600115 [Rhizobium etli CNPAF512]|nr:hypothetical protein RHECNPAF_12600115 [Rhizobium etli CNPAF512]